MPESGWRDARDWPTERIIEGVITREQVDKQGDLIRMDAFDMGRFAKRGHLVLEHGRSKSGVVILGECIGWRPVDSSIEARFGVYADGNPVVDAAWGRMKEAGLKGAFSIGGVPLEEPECDEQSGVCLFKRIALQEVSWVKDPANPGAIVTFIESKAASLGTAVLEPAIVGRFVVRQKSMPGGRLKVEAIMDQCGLCKEYAEAAVREGQDGPVAVTHLATVINRALDTLTAGDSMPDAPAQAPAPAAPEKKPEEQGKAPSIEDRMNALEAMVKELMAKVDGYAKAATAAQAPASPAPAPAAQKGMTPDEVAGAVEKAFQARGFTLVKTAGTGPTPATGTTPGGTGAPTDARALVKEALASDKGDGGLLQRLQRKARPTP